MREIRNPAVSSFLKAGLTIFLLLTLSAYQLISLSSFVGAAEPMAKIAKKISTGAKSLKNKKVAVLPFPYHDGRESEGSTIVSERLTTKLVEEKKLEVVERSLLQKVFSELKLQSSGAIDEQSAKQLGKVLGVEGIVTGTLIDLGENEMEVNARLIQVESGQILVASSGKVDRFWQEKVVSTKILDESVKTELSPAQALEKPATLPPVGQSPPLPHPEEMDKAQHKPPLVLSNRPEPHQPPSHPTQHFPQDMPPGKTQPMDEETDENQILPGRIDELIFEADMGHEARSPSVQQIVEGLRLLKNKEGNRAEEYFSSLRENFRGKPGLQILAQLGLSMSLFQQGKVEKAIREAEDVTQARNWPFPRLRARAHFLLGRYAEELGKVHKAKEHYLEVIRTHPFQTAIVQKAGRRLKRLGMNR